MEDDDAVFATGKRDRSTPHDSPGEPPGEPGRPETEPPPGRMTPAAMQQCIDEAVQHSRQRLASSRAAVARGQTRVNTGKAWTDHVRAGLMQSQALVREFREKPTPGTPAEPSRCDPADLRRRLGDVALKIADLETRIAEDHEKAAAQFPGTASDKLRIAADARQGAQKARELARRFGGPEI